MKKRIYYGFALILLALASWLMVGFYWGSPTSGLTIIRTIALWLFASVLAFAFWRLKFGLRINIGLLIMAGLFLPNSSLVAHPSLNHPGPFQNLLETTLFFLPSLALVSAALLLHAGINRYQSWKAAGRVDGGGSSTQRKQDGRAAMILIGLSGLLLAKTLHSLYWLTIWDNANDPLGYLLIFAPVLVALFSGGILSIMLPGRAKWTGPLFALFIPALMIVVSASAQGVDFRQLTEARAGQVSRAIETYFAREGRYPQDLRQLTPWYFLSIPRPVIIYGQGWCYQTDADYYRRGFIYRDHWSSPILTGRIYGSKGQAPDLSHLCDTEMTALRGSYPDFPWEYSMK
jgi:hypothetical protein